MSVPESDPPVYAFRALAEYYKNLLPVQGGRRTRGVQLPDQTNIHLNYFPSRSTRGESYAGAVTNRQIRMSVYFDVHQIGLRTFGINSRILTDSLLSEPELPSFIVLTEENSETDLVRRFQNAAKPLAEWLIDIKLEGKFSPPPILIV